MVLHVHHGGFLRQSRTFFLVLPIILSLVPSKIRHYTVQRFIHVINIYIALLFLLRPPPPLPPLKKNTHTHTHTQLTHTPGLLTYRIRSIFPGPGRAEEVQRQREEIVVDQTGVHAERSHHEEHVARRVPGDPPRHGLSSPRAKKRNENNNKRTKSKIAGQGLRFVKTPVSTVSRCHSSLSRAWARNASF